MSIALNLKAIGKFSNVEFQMICIMFLTDEIILLW